MPIYEYACRSCGHQFETIQKSSEEPLTDCPACGDTALRKLLSAPVFRLKGSGWYETDFKTGDRRNVTEGKETEAPGNGDSADKPADGGKAKESSDTSPGAAASSTNTNGKSTDRASGGKSSSASGGSSASAPDAG